MKLTPCYNMIETPEGAYCWAGLKFPDDCKRSCRAAYMPEAGEGEFGADWIRIKLWRDYVTDGLGPHDD